MAEQLSTETLLLKRTKALGPLWRIGVTATSITAAQTLRLVEDVRRELDPVGIEVTVLDAPGRDPHPAVDLIVSATSGSEFAAAAIAVREGVPLVRLRGEVPTGLAQLLGRARVAEYPVLEVAIRGQSYLVFSKLEFHDVKAEVEVAAVDGTCHSFHDDIEIEWPSPWSSSRSGERRPAALRVRVRWGTEVIEIAKERLPISFRSPRSMLVSAVGGPSRKLLESDEAAYIRYAAEQLGVLVTSG